MLGGSLGPITVGIDSGGPFNVGKMLQAAEHWPINFGFLGRGNSHKPASLGVLRCDLLVVNKIDLAPFVGVDLDAMLTEARAVRQGRPILATNARTGDGVAAVADAMNQAVLFR